MKKNGQKNPVRTLKKVIRKVENIIEPFVDQSDDCEHHKHSKVAPAKRLNSIGATAKKININSPNAKEKILVKQALGSLNRIAEMIEGNEYCPKIIQQVDSVSGMLKSLKKELLAGHLDSCVLSKMKENKKSAIDELLAIYNLTN